MKIRSVNIDDIPFLRGIHEKFYNNLKMPDFTKLLSGFIITNDKDEFIMAGAIQPIAETILITNRDANMVSIGRALIEARNISIYTCKQYDIPEINAFVTDENYANHLIKYGFSRRNQIPLFLRLENG